MSSAIDTVLYGNFIFNNGWRSPRTQTAMNEVVIERT